MLIKFHSVHNRPSEAAATTVFLFICGHYHYHSNHYHYQAEEGVLVCCENLYFVFNAFEVADETTDVMKRLTCHTCLGCKIHLETSSPSLVVSKKHQRDS